MLSLTFFAKPTTSGIAAEAFGRGHVDCRYNQGGSNDRIESTLQRIISDDECRMRTRWTYEEGIPRPQDVCTVDEADYNLSSLCQVTLFLNWIDCELFVWFFFWLMHRPQITDKYVCQKGPRIETGHNIECIEGLIGKKESIGVNLILVAISQ